MTEIAPLPHIDEINLSRLNLISAVDKAETSEWEVRHEDGGRIVQIRCDALAKYAVPHGLDSDVTSALLNLFSESGMPEDGRFIISATALLRRCGWHNSGHYHEVLKTSLERLHTSSYTVSGGWRDHPKGRWTHAKFHFLESLEFTSSDIAGNFDDRSVIAGRIADVLVKSIKSGYVKPLNTEFMLSLSRPRTRVIYRILDGTRYHPENLNLISNEYDINLMAWAEQCRIPSLLPGNIRRALEGPNKELIERGYLKSVSITGRGKEQRIKYIFNNDFVEIDPILAQRLRDYGIADGIARRLSGELGSKVLGERIDRFDWLVRTKILVIKKSKAAAFIHSIQHPDEYPYPDKDKAPVKETKKTSSTVETPSPPSLIDELTLLPKEEAVELAVTRLAFYYKKELPPIYLDILRSAFLEGQLPIAETVQMAIGAMAKSEKQEFISSLLDKLNK